MKQNRQKQYGEKWENKQGYPQKYKKKKQYYYKKTTYPWKNQQKSIKST